jgi:hypothetical protein
VPKASPLTVGVFHCLRRWLKCLLLTSRLESLRDFQNQQPLLDEERPFSGFTAGALRQVVAQCNMVAAALDAVRESRAFRAVLAATLGPEQGGGSGG